MRATIWPFIFAVALTAASAMPATAESLGVEDGLMAHWSFDASTGATITDVSGNGHHGTLHGAGRTSGVVGNALDFDGTGDAWVPTQGVVPPAAITGLSVGTVAMWLRYDDSDQEAEPLFYLGNFEDREKPGATVEVGHPDNNKLYFTFYAGGPRPTLCFDSNFNLEPGVWYHFVGVVGEDFNTGYLNGVEMTDRNYNAGGPEDSMFFADLANVNRLTLGSAYYHQDLFLYGHGAVDEVRIYDRPLSAAEALALYSGGEPPANHAPSANDDAATTPVGTPVTIDVLGNDTDADGDTLAVGALGDPVHGTATTDGSQVTYLPESGWQGSDSFSYTIADPDGATDTATVTVTVGDAGGTEVPTAPIKLEALPMSETEALLTWLDTSDGPAQETHFELQRSNRSIRSGWTTVATIPADSLWFIDGDLETGTRYGYRICAVNDEGSSPWSNRIRVTI